LRKAISINSFIRWEKGTEKIMLFQSLKNRKDGLQNKKNLMSNPNLVPGKKYKKKTHTFFFKYAQLTYKSIL